VPVDCSPAIEAAAASRVAGVSTRYSAMIRDDDIFAFFQSILAVGKG
jgi:hypothetical protein